tara:strand:+ start:99 stop:473 length:375 start_codon:yes stop_codon:yes gene_type:complete
LPKPAPIPVAARRRCIGYLGVLQDVSSTAGEKSNAARNLSELYAKHPDLATVKLDADDTNETVPAWLTREKLSAVLHKGVRTADKVGAIDGDTGSLLRSIIADWLDNDDAEAWQDDDGADPHRK